MNTKITLLSEKTQNFGKYLIVCSICIIFLSFNILDVKEISIEGVNVSLRSDLIPISLLLLNIYLRLIFRNLYKLDELEINTIKPSVETIKEYKILNYNLPLALFMLASLSVITKVIIIASTKDHPIDYILENDIQLTKDLLAP